MKRNYFLAAACVALAGCAGGREDYADTAVRDSWGTVPGTFERAGSSVVHGTERVAVSTGRGIARTGETIEEVGERTGQSIHHGAEWVGERVEGRPMHSRTLGDK